MTGSPLGTLINKVGANRRGAGAHHARSGFKLYAAELLNWLPNLNREMYSMSAVRDHPVMGALIGVGVWATKKRPMGRL